MSGIALFMDLLRKNPSLNGQTLHATGLYSATLAASSAAAYIAVGTPFASRALFGEKRFAFCDAAPTPSLSAEDYLTSLRTASETISRHDVLNYSTKEYSIELKPLFSAFQPRPFVMTSLRSFLLFYLPILVPKVEDDGNDDFLPDSSDDHHVDLVVPFKKSVKQIIRETSVVTTRRVLERLAVHHFSQRAAWKLLKDVPKSAIRKANRGMPFYTYFFCVSRTTFRGQL
ncbi:uncharacterized protein LOC143601896, partial [Bidens hawaiensis]|uniref:uncharacterized protein LOC143601896 n=1 Tax=Bidens hawaiensis TaxID=980011 RepID=UPI00404AB586